MSIDSLLSIPFLGIRNLLGGGGTGSGIVGGLANGISDQFMPEQQGADGIGASLLPNPLFGLGMPQYGGSGPNFGETGRMWNQLGQTGDGGGVNDMVSAAEKEFMSQLSPRQRAMYLFQKKQQQQSEAASILSNTFAARHQIIMVFANNIRA